MDDLSNLAGLKDRTVTAALADVMRGMFVGLRVGCIRLTISKWLAWNDQRCQFLMRRSRVRPGGEDRGNNELYND
ncbi:MAG TPA: hypothetical protein VLZ89_13530 [Anaerolineales bacterium]|nr:hypothetical protein [Anaerolineales bacterium]